ncbi:hypothetical protein N0V90_001207 [Kalmusia sp. IMI 367209]|nr:hypothetical protein N0V90_001207 [Kalmusia sp. IMI 367209]
MMQPHTLTDSERIAELEAKNKRLETENLLLQQDAKNQRMCALTRGRMLAERDKKIEEQEKSIKDWDADYMFAQEQHNTEMQRRDVYDAEQRALYTVLNDQHTTICAAYSEEKDRREELESENVYLNAKVNALEVEAKINEGKIASQDMVIAYKNSTIANQNKLLSRTVKGDITVGELAQQFSAANLEEEHVHKRAKAEDAPKPAKELSDQGKALVAQNICPAYYNGRCRYSANKCPYRHVARDKNNKPDTPQPVSMEGHSFA